MYYLVNKIQNFYSPIGLDMKKFIYLLLCSGMLVACGKQSDGSNSASAAKSASEAPATASAAEGKEQVAASSGVSEAKQSGDNSEVFKQFDQELAQIQKQLPLKMNETFEFTSVERRGNKVYYSYTFKDSKVSSKSFNKAVADQTFKASCQNPTLKQLFDKGVEFIYVYHFVDKSEITMTLSAKNCQ